MRHFRSPGHRRAVRRKFLHGALGDVEAPMAHPSEPPHPGPFGPWPGGGVPLPPVPPVPPPPAGWPPGWGGGHRGPARGRGHGRRHRRGDVRAAILALLAERPMHGYEMIQQISERSGGFWRPSPGSVYPTLQLLADEALITNRDGGGKRLFELTEDGRAEIEKRDDTPPWEHIAREVDPGEVSLRTAMGQLVSAIYQVAQAGTSSQKSRAVDTLNQTRRELYAILGDIDEESTGPDAPVSEG